jgi:enoyl-CoA hydratase/carnithine racemase
VIVLNRSPAPGSTAIPEEPDVSETIATDLSDEVLTITLDRPARRNAMDVVMAREVHAALGALDGVGAVVLTGAEGTFSAGADIKSGSGVGGGGITWFDTFDLLLGLEVPVVAAIEGWCLGGGLELALCCDLRVAGETARLGTPEVRHGVFPAGGGTQRLPDVVGRGRAKELLLVGDPLDAATAERWGLVNRVVPEGSALAVARELAVRMAGHDRAAVAAIKRLTADQLDAGIARERVEIAALITPS